MDRTDCRITQSVLRTVGRVGVIEGGEVEFVFGVAAVAGSGLDHGEVGYGFCEILRVGVARRGLF